MSSRISVSVCLVAVLILGAVAAQSMARFAASYASPTAIGTVDLERIFVNLKAFEAANDELRRIDADFNAERAVKRDEITQLQEELEILPPGSSNRRDAENALLWKSHEFQVMVEIARRKLDDAEAQALRRIYKLVQDEAAVLARDRGFDLIIIDDTRVDLPENASAADMTREIGARRYLHVGRSIDVTDELIARVNSR